LTSAITLLLAVENEKCDIHNKFCENGSFVSKVKMRGLTVLFACGLRAIELVCLFVCLFVCLCYLPANLHHQHMQEADVSHYLQSHVVFLDVPNGIFQSRVEKQWRLLPFWIRKLSEKCKI
jgi:hypothetical protein